MNIKRLVTGLILAALMLATVSIGAAAKGPGGGGGGGHTEVATNNLSVPTIMVGGGFTNVNCPVDAPAALVYPTGQPLTGFELEGYYYVQGVNKWQAQCYTATTTTAQAEWGDNLAGDAKLQVGKPIRVELGLETNAYGNMDGFTVVKLQPSKLDRESAYGTLATSNDGGLTYQATATTFTSVRVYDPGVTFSVKNVATGTYVVPLGSNPTAEINATGRVVYGYNLRVGAVGQYEITFVIPSVNITGVDAGTYIPNPDGADTVSITITVISGGGGRKP